MLHFNYILTKNKKKKIWVSGFYENHRSDKLVPYPMLGAEQRPYCAAVTRTNRGLSLVPPLAVFLRQVASLLSASAFLILKWGR